MSAKITLFLTEDNEHFYEEGLEPNKTNGNSIEYTLYLKMSKKNIEIVLNDKDDLVISAKPGSELYTYLKKMKGYAESRLEAFEQDVRHKITYSMAYDVDWDKEIKVGGKALTFEEKVLYSNAYVSGLKKAMEIIEQEILTLCQ